MWPDVMAVSSWAAGSGCVCAGMWRAEGLRLGVVGVRRGHDGGREGIRPKWKRVLLSYSFSDTHIHMAPCPTLTSNYLESYHTVPAGETNLLNMYILFYRDQHNRYFLINDLSVLLNIILLNILSSG